MARTSMNVPLGYIYELRKVGSDWTLMKYSGNQVNLENGKSGSTKFEYWCCSELPDLKSVLGNKILYEITATARFWGAVNSGQTKYIRSGVVTREFPDMPDRDDYIKYGMPYLPNLGSDIFAGTILSPGINMTLDYEYNQFYNQSSTAYQYLHYRNICFIPYPYYSGGLNTAYIMRTLQDDTTIPYVTIYYDDTEVAPSIVKVSSGPTEGYINPRENVPLSWYYLIDYDSTNYRCLNLYFEPLHTTLYWKTSGESTYHSVALPDGATNGTIPANTFPVHETIEWYLAGEDVYNCTSESEHYTFSTISTDIVSTAISPINTIEAGSTPITFKWDLSSDIDLPASRVILEWKTPSGQVWNEIVDEDEAITEYTVDSNYFSFGGEKQWRVTAYNIDGIQGNPSEVVSFYVVAAPVTPTVFSNSLPFVTIAWQSDGQQSYEVDIDGKRYGPYFGTEKSFASPDYLEDGTHFARVRTMGDYGLWSNWGEVEFTVQNALYTELSTTCRTSIDAELDWDSADNASYYLVYRDGKQIARTSGTDFIDRVCLGSHEYVIVCRLQNDYYAKSRTFEKTESVDCLHVALLSGGDWVRIEHGKKSQSEPKYNDKRSVGYTHLSGHRYPVADYFEFDDTDAEYTAVFLYTEEDERKRFVSMFGKPVILKTPDDEVVIGILEGWTRENREQKVNTYSFTIHRVDWGDFIDVP